MRWQITIPEGAEFPRGYGLAYRNWMTLNAVCMPVPLNVIVGAGRRFWFALVHGVRPSRWDAKVICARREGWQAGWAAHGGDRREGNRRLMNNEIG